VTDPRTHTVAGAAQAWAQLHAVPVSRFTRLQEALADTSNECSDFTHYPGQTEGFATAEVRKQVQQCRSARAFGRDAAPNQRRRNPACSQ